ncbi:MAG: DUF2062 domain-containing protein [Deltaproteobacteria bacterium]|nr:DUF2062 domain-containing protein [Deltaproteobacteria bacterium]
MWHTSPAMVDRPKMSGPGRTIRGRLKSLIRRGWVTVYRLAREKDPPERVALGLALGIFVGFLPIMGIQMAVVSIIALPLRGNLKAAIAGVWISNPITFIPLYYANYRFGLLFWPEKGASKEAFVAALEAAADFSWSAIWDSLTALFNMGTDIMFPLWIGSCITAVVFGVPTYFATKRLVIKYRQRREAARIRKQIKKQQKEDRQAGA